MAEAIVKSLIRDVPNFPRPGIVFKDITPVLADPVAFEAALAAMVAPFADLGVTKVAGIEARGFMFAAPISCLLDAGFVPIRKPGKLPLATVAQEYELEYGTDSIEVHSDAFHPGEHVLIVDDVLATGGTAAASIALVEKLGAVVVGVSVLLELEFLEGRSRINGVPVHALVVDGAG